MGDLSPALAGQEEAGPPAAGPALRAVVAHSNPDTERETLAALHLGWPGATVHCANSPGGCAETVRWLRPQLVVVEAGGGAQWLALIRQIRQMTEAVVVVVGQKEEEANLIEAVEAGADDYFPLPLNGAVFVARIRAALRRAHLTENPGAAKLAYGDLEIDPERHEARANGHCLNLSPTEFELLLSLARRPECVLRHEVLCQTIWGDSPNFCEATLRKHIENLRRKLAQAPGARTAILTVPRVGYRLVALEAPAPSQQAAI